MLIYVPVAYLADRAHKKPFVLMTFAFFTMFPRVLLFSRSFWALVGAFVFGVAGTLWFAAATPGSALGRLGPH